MRSARRVRLLGVALAAAFVLVAAQAAFADVPVVRFTAADQAAAMRGVIKLSDLTEGFRGGTKVPNIRRDEPPCAKFDPKQSDLVVTGVAESWASAPPVSIVSRVTMMKTPRMAQLNWQRTVLAPGLLPCLSKSEPGQKLISVKRVPFPKIAPRTARIRQVVELSGTFGTMRLTMDFITLSRGRTECGLVISVPERDRPLLDETGVGLAQLMLSRARA